MVPNELLTKSFSIACCFCLSKFPLSFSSKFPVYWVFLFLVLILVLSCHMFALLRLYIVLFSLLTFLVFVFDFVRGIHCSPYAFLYPGCPLSFLVSCSILFSVLFRRKKYEKETLYVCLKSFSVRYELDTSKLKCVDRYIQKFFTFNGFKDILSFASLTQDHILL